ncbi:hypothetical protein HOC35_02935 [Candidatus Woesearchaeota archaeon]|jgi:hypothetical protein|nr:hypothetical protein [Candidatus Woesearchaeota archaeon]
MTDTKTMPDKEFKELSNYCKEKFGVTIDKKIFFKYFKNKKDFGMCLSYLRSDTNSNFLNNTKSICPKCGNILLRTNLFVIDGAMAKEGSDDSIGGNDYLCLKCGVACKIIEKPKDKKKLHNCKPRLVFIDKPKFGTMYVD